MEKKEEKTKNLTHNDSQTKKTQGKYEKKEFQNLLQTKKSLIERKNNEEEEENEKDDKDEDSIIIDLEYKSDSDVDKKEKKKKEKKEEKIIRDENQILNNLKKKQIDKMFDINVNHPKLVYAENHDKSYLW